MDEKDEKATLLRHVLDGNTVLAADVTPGPVKTLGGEVINLMKTGNGDVGIIYKKNLINVVTADIMASNGVIHVIDKLILPSKFPIFRFNSKETSVLYMSTFFSFGS